jgi:hypothetical protein
MAKLVFILSDSIPNTVWSKKVTKVAKMTTNSANHPRPSLGHGCVPALSATGAVSMVVGAIAIVLSPRCPAFTRVLSQFPCRVF